jgi:hypothetical protein
MSNPFEYDVFLSFSSADEEIVKPIWQELCSNGLRVFWSDAILKKEVGNSWFEVIERSLERSKHMLLVCSENSMNSKWVQREYRAFYDQCYSADTRRLIPVLAHGYKPNDLPLFLRGLQVGNIDDHQFIKEIIPILGGVNFEKLQFELQSLKEEIRSLLSENTLLSEQLKRETNRANTSDKEAVDKKKQLDILTKVNRTLVEMSEERENSLSTEISSLEKQVRKLNNDNQALVEKSSVEEANQGRRLGWPRLFVYNLGDQVSSNDLWVLFSSAGSIKLSQIIKDEAGNSLGIGFIVMSYYADAEKAINMFQGKDYQGRTLSIYPSS